MATANQPSAALLQPLLLTQHLVIVGASMTDPNIVRLTFGGSEGGREGLLMAQQHPKEFDGIFVRNSVIGWSGLFSNFINTLHAVERDDKAGAFTSSDTALLARTSAAACDSRDGSADGVLSDYQSCQEPVRAAVDRLECQDVPQPGTCLTAAQLRVVDAVYEPYNLGYTLPSGAEQLSRILLRR